MRLITAVLCLGLLCHVVPARATDTDSATAVIPKEWLDEQITVAEAEAEHPGITDERVRGVPETGRPFGFMNREWEDLKAAMQPGDELWTFSSPPKSWKDLAGRAGIALARDGVPIKVLVTILN